MKSNRTKKKRKKSETTKLKDKLWTLVSEYSRRKDSTGDHGNCVTCSELILWKEGHAGHFIPKAQGEFYRWELKNIHLQCPVCNLGVYNPYRQGRVPNETVKVRYTLYMQERYGQEYVDYLLDKSDKGRKFYDSDYEDMIESIEQMVKALD